MLSCCRREGDINGTLSNVVLVHSAGPNPAIAGRRDFDLSDLVRVGD